ncbi:MAG: FAD-dependent oxidoreductase [Lachnospiraceae bacterium]|nr:FAD-dependent oxidoreductase [Lachnospiraceae bacterium]
MLRIPQLKLHIRHSEEELKRAIQKELRLQNDDFTFTIRKRSLDARKKQELHYVYCIDVTLPEKEEKKVLAKAKGKVVSAPDESYRFVPVKGLPASEKRPVVIGAGPAGLFCAYFLSMYGYRPIVLERGEKMEDRMQRVEEFWKTGILDTESNVQFGEGGAGTFSDGKLNTMVKDPYGRIRKVLEIFAEHGAPEEILYLNKPHIGTDCLRNVIISMRKHMEQLGATFRFSSKVTDICMKDGRICGVEINNTEILDCNIVVAAIGHSARDTFEMLLKKPLAMESKAFAVGVRIEHPQELIGRAQYGDFYRELPAADYKLTYQTESGRGVYSFCMCPGGFVVNASSEEGRLVVNGMSNHDRGERNANSALIVTVTPEDFDREGMQGPLAGMHFQRKWEEAAYLQGQGKIPVQLFGDLLLKKKSDTIGEIIPNTKGEYVLSELSGCLPSYVIESLIEGILAFDKKIPGYAAKDVPLLGVETRTSSPVRIPRDESMQSQIGGFYPCGEGAGYAGGITSAAVDGIKVFEAIASLYGTMGE